MRPLSQVALVLVTLAAGPLALAAGPSAADYTNCKPNPPTPPGTTGTIWHRQGKILHGLVYDSMDLALKDPGLKKYFDAVPHNAQRHRGTLVDERYA